MTGAASAALTGLLIYEPFDYTTGPITGQQNNSSAQTEVWFQAGTAASSAANQHSIVPDTLTAPPNGAPAPSAGNMADLKQTDVTELERMNIPGALNGAIPVYGNNSVLYYSLLLNVPSTSGLTISSTNVNANNDLIVGLNNTQGSQAARPNSWGGELIIKQGSAAGTYRLGIRGSTTTAGTTFFTPDIAAGGTHFIVVSASLDNANVGSNSIWVDPLSATFGQASPPSADGTSGGTGGAGYSYQSVLMGSGIAAGASAADVYVDEFRLGNSWTDVTVPETPAPEPASVGMLASLAGLGLLRRRRRTG